MNPVVSNVWCCDNFQLRLQFSNGEERMFDCTPYLELGVFSALTDPAIFATAKVVVGSVEWDGEIGLSYDTLYHESFELSVFLKKAYQELGVDGYITFVQSLGLTCGDYTAEKQNRADDISVDDIYTELLAMRKNNGTPNATNTT